MTKLKRLTFSTILLTLTLLLLACGEGTPLPPTPEPASISQGTAVAPDSPAPGQPPPPGDGDMTEEPAIAGDAVSVPGLMIAYIREGNLWFWTEAGVPHQMTGGGDLSTASISDDGQTLAFMRGVEIWTAHTDGAEARLLATRAIEGGALWLSPNGLLLAVSDKEQIQVIDLNTSSITTVLTYPTIAGGYSPEVVWSLDSSGFKTVIPAGADNGQAEFFFIFPDGTVASLAKFAMILPDESAPFLSPDGGYLIYAAKVADGKDSLHLMDSSGATRPYGEPAEAVRAYGWLPDSKRFVYGSGSPSRTFFGDVGGQPVEIPLEEFGTLRWVDAEHFLGLKDDGLYLGSLNGGKLLVDSGVTTFDFAR